MASEPLYIAPLLCICSLGNPAPWSEERPSRGALVRLPKDETAQILPNLFHRRPPPRYSLSAVAAHAIFVLEGPRKCADYSANHTSAAVQPQAFPCSSFFDVASRSPLLLYILYTTLEPKP
ncbi:unnamed protein product [Ixodes persulcatus]